MTSFKSSKLLSLTVNNLVNPLISAQRIAASTIFLFFPFKDKLSNDNFFSTSSNLISLRFIFLVSSSTVFLISSKSLNSSSFFLSSKISKYG